MWYLYLVNKSVCTATHYTPCGEPITTPLSWFSNNPTSHVIPFSHLHFTSCFHFIFDLPSLPLPSTSLIDSFGQAFIHFHMAKPSLFRTLKFTTNISNFTPHASQTCSSVPMGNTTGFLVQLISTPPVRVWCPPVVSRFNCMLGVAGRSTENCFPSWQWEDFHSVQKVSCTEPEWGVPYLVVKHGHLKQMI